MLSLKLNLFCKFISSTTMVVMMMTMMMMTILLIPPVFNYVPPLYKMCVPQQIFESCKDLMDQSSATNSVTIECVSGRDRMDCLNRINHREADFMAVDPEDMYVAHQMKNEDFSVFSEIRTIIESEAEFRYEGIILVHRNSDIHSLANLKGKKSCHTGFGRNVGYKIPITKLKKIGVLKVSANPALSPVEIELKGLSNLFTQSCLVGTYSANPNVNQILKKRYANLCALCEDPVKCNYPDKYSGYDGAIRCLVENGGDVAFTKVIYVRRFFGLPIGNHAATTQAEANPDDYEYLCENGTRRPVTGVACSWAQRPWQGYMGNADVNVRLTALQNKINQFYTNGKTIANTKIAKDMWISADNVIVKKEQEINPEQHLTRAKYKEVIERDGSTQQKIRLCVSSEIELEKCKTMKSAAYSRDIRPEFKCILSADCIKNVKEQHADVVVLPITYHKKARNNQLKSILYEQIDPNSNYVAVVPKNIANPLISKVGISYDTRDVRSIDAALYFNFKRKISICPGSLLSYNDSQIEIVRFPIQRNETKYTDCELLCPDGSHQSINDGKFCNFDATLGVSVYVSNDINTIEYENILHAFTSISDKFGKGGKLEDVFRLFGGTYGTEHEQRNILFSDDGSKLITEMPSATQQIDENLYYRIHCL